MTIPHDRLPEWQAVLRRSFCERWGGPYRRRDFFRDYVTHDPHFKHGNLIGLVVDDQIVSAYQRFQRRMVVGTRTYRIEGIGNVGTDPRHQRRGYGTMLMRSYLQDDRQRDVAFLQAGDGAFYRRIGWRPLGRRSLSVAKALDDRLLERGAISCRRATVGDLRALARIYVQFNRAEGLPYVIRSAAYWRQWVWDWKLRIYRLEADVFFDRRKRLLGYAFSRVNGSTMTVDEYGALPAARDQFYHALIAEFHRRRRVTTLSLTRSVGSLERFLDTESISYEVTGGSHETGYGYIFHSALIRWRDRIGLWHVDHC